MSITPADLRVLYRDPHLIAIDKPSGLLCHRSEIARDVHVYALQLVRKLVGRRVYGPHRLDRGTSGVLLFGLDREIARALADAFAGHEVDKTYHAIVRGHPPAEGTIDHAIATSETGEPKEAVTDYTVLARGALPVPVGNYPETWAALVRLHPRTGRRHQLRRHLVHIRHPIIGDTTYGDGKNNRVFRAELGIDRLMLYASRLALTHPVTGERIEIHAPPEPQLTAACARFGWPDPHALAVPAAPGPHAPDPHAPNPHAPAAPPEPQP